MSFIIALSLRLSFVALIYHLGYNWRNMSDTDGMFFLAFFDRSSKLNENEF